MASSRIYFIDNSKFIGIFLVVLGHCSLPLFSNAFVFSFHIPLFFLISGLLFSFEKHPTYFSFLKHRAVQLLIPYLSFNLITYLFWLLIGRRFGEDAVLNIPVYKPLIGILYGNGIDNYLIHCTPIWFIACLFVVENLYYLVFKNISRRYLGVVAFIIIGYADYFLKLPRLPWGINIAFTALVFYGVGNIFKGYIISQLNKNVFILSVAALVFLALTLVIAYFNSSVDMNHRGYSNYFYFLIGGFSGTFCVLILSQIIYKVLPRSSFVEYIARNTIFIIAFQGISGSLLKGLSLYVFKIPLSFYTDKILVNIIFSFLAILLIIPVIYIISNYLPILIGRKKEIRAASKP